MFREMARRNQMLTKEECIEVLRKEPRGVLSVLGEDDYPYAVPINYWYNEENETLFFHSGMEGHKIDAIKKYDKVSFCVYDQGYRKDGDWALSIKSVIIFGRIKIVEDQKKMIEFCRELSYKYTSDTEYIEEEIKKYTKNVLCFELIPEHMSGKLVREA